MRPSLLSRSLRASVPWKRHRVRRPLCATNGSEGLPSRSYRSGDGRPKTTVEEVFTSSSAVTPRSVSAPWEFGWQMNERNIQWVDTFKIKLIKRFTAEELNISDAECEERLQILTDVVPGIGPRMQKMPPKLIAELLSYTHTLANTLLELKSIFPQADVSSLLISRPSLAGKESLQDVAVAAEELRRLLPHSNVDVLVEKHPTLLDIDQLKESMKLLENLMPGSNFEEVLHKNAQVLFSLQKGRNMIPYDEVPTSAP